MRTTRQTINTETRDYVGVFIETDDGADMTAYLFEKPSVVVQGVSIEECISELKKSLMIMLNYENQN